jgi:transcriptional regulator with XRE-family HTH domain
MTRGKRLLACETLDVRLKRARKEQGMSARELSLAAGLSPNVVQMIEEQGRLPALDTVERLASVLSVSTAWLAFGTGPQVRQEVSYYVAPGTDTLAMVRELEALLTGPGGHIEQTYKYLDAADAAHWCALTQQDRYSGFGEAKPLESVAAAIAENAGRLGLDILGLGVGTGEHEARLVGHVLAQECKNLRLFLLDISQPLLSIACQRATELLSAHPTLPIIAVHGNFFQLPSYEAIFQVPHRRQRLFTMFGNTLGNLDNEIRFLRNSLSGAVRGDLFLLDVGIARAPADQPEQIIANEPVLARNLPQELQRQLKLQEKFNIGPLLRYRHDLSDFEYSYSLDTTSCVIPGSYAIHMRANLKFYKGGGALFSLGYIKRYDTRKLADSLLKEGWEEIASWDYKHHALMLLRRG